MGSNIVRVNPASVMSYQSSAQENFAGIHQQLVTLVNEVVDVHYFGPNASSFKQDCGVLATEFANGLSRQLGGIAAAVNAATSNIATALGGARIALTWERKPFTAPTPAQGDGSVDIDTSALSSLKSTVDSRFASISEGLDRHLASLSATDWVGTAKDQVVTEVSSRTRASVAQVQAAQTKLNTFIQQQVDDVVNADRVA